MKVFLILITITLAAGCGSGSKGSDSANPTPKNDDQKATLTSTSWCMQLGSSVNGFSYRQILLISDGTLIDAYFQKMAADRKPSNLTNKQNGTWALEGSSLTLTTGSQKTTYSKFVLIDDISGKDLKLYDSNDLFELYYSCKQSSELGMGRLGQGGKTSAETSLKSELDQGKALRITMVDTKLANEINDRMGTRKLITLQDGKKVIRGDDLKNWCQIGSQNGFVNGGDRFEIKTSEVHDKIYLAARQVYLRLSPPLGIQCRKGGMDQSEMSLGEIQTIVGPLIKLELAE